MISFIEFCNNINNWFLKESTLSIKHFIQDYLNNPGDFTPIAALGDWLDENGETELSELIKEVFNELNQYPPRYTFRRAVDIDQNIIPKSPVESLDHKIYSKIFKFYDKTGIEFDIKNGHLIRFNRRHRLFSRRSEDVDLDSLNQEEIKQVVLLILVDWVKALKILKPDQSEMPENLGDRKSFEFWNRWIEWYKDADFVLIRYLNNGEYDDDINDNIGWLIDKVIHFKAEAEPMLPMLKKFPKSKEMANTLRNNIQRCIDYTRMVAHRDIDVLSLEKNLQDIDYWLQRNFS